MKTIGDYFRMGCGLVLVLAAQANASPGGLDPSFGSGGKKLIDLSTPGAAGGIALQGDGKIILAGSAIWRLNADGSLDATFNETGKVPAETGSSFSSVAVQVDGKILASGTLKTKSSGSPNSPLRDYFSLRRVNANGSNDGALHAGILTNENANENCWGMVLQSDGKAVLAGWSRDSNNIIDFGLQRRNANLSRDTGFDSNSPQSRSTDRFQLKQFVPF